MEETKNFFKVNFEDYEDMSENILREDFLNMLNDDVLYEHIEEQCKNMYNIDKDKTNYLEIFEEKFTRLIEKYINNLELQNDIKLLYTQIYNDIVNIINKYLPITDIISVLEEKYLYKTIIAIYKYIIIQPEIYIINFIKNFIKLNINSLNSYINNNSNNMNKHELEKFIGSGIPADIANIINNLKIIFNIIYNTELTMNDIFTIICDNIIDEDIYTSVIKKNFTENIYNNFLYIKINEEFKQKFLYYIYIDS